MTTIEYRFVKIVLTFTGNVPTFAISHPVNASVGTVTEVRDAIDAALNC